MTLKFLMYLLVISSSILVVYGCSPTKPDVDEYGCYAKSEAYVTKQTSKSHDVFTKAAPLNPAFFGPFIVANLALAPLNHHDAYNCCLAYNKNTVKILNLDEKMLKWFKSWPYRFYFIENVDDKGVYCVTGNHSKSPGGAIREQYMMILIPWEFIGQRKTVSFVPARKRLPH